MENMSSENTEEGHCSRIVIEGLVCLSKAHTGGDPIAERSKDEWQPAGLGRQGKS
jgi:hypothetical protein